MHFQNLKKLQVSAANEMGESRFQFARLSSLCPKTKKKNKVDNTYTPATTTKTRSKLSKLVKRLRLLHFYVFHFSLQKRKQSFFIHAFFAVCSPWVRYFFTLCLLCGSLVPTAALARRAAPHSTAVHCACVFANFFF